MDSFDRVPDAARMILGIGMQIPDVIADLQDALNECGQDPQRAARLSAPQTSWRTAEPETRAAILHNAAWASRVAHIDTSAAHPHVQGYAADLHEYAQAAPDSETFHGPAFPAMPLPGQAGALSTSLAFDRDDLPISLETAMVLIAHIPDQEKSAAESGAIEGVILPVEKSVNEWGGTTYTWTCPKCKGVIKSHTSDKEKAIKWIAKYAPHISCGESEESAPES